ncbi:MAG: hypothetical protein JJE50_09295 [Actinomycetales bacterium]|nr:hypothetical protein [Actinomycetales bacterium]
MASKSRLMMVASSLVVGGLALAGCAGQPGAAAVVDGRPISEGYLAEAGAEFAPYSGSPLSPADMLTALIQAPVVVQVGSEHGVGVSTQEAVDRLDSVSETSQIATDGEYADGTVQLVQMILTYDALQNSPDSQAISEEVTARIADTDVEINPRYGQWDPKGTIVPVTPEWLIDSTPAAG